MKLSEQELKILERASRELRTWPYERVAFLVIGIGVIIFGFWLIYRGEFVLNPLSKWIAGGLNAIGVGILGYIWTNWEAPKPRLLVKLSRNSHDSAA